MKRLAALIAIIFFAVMLSGCALLGGIATDIQEIDATQEVQAVSDLTSDIVNQPWDNIVQVGLGYGLALIRRWYKKKKGAK